MSTSTVSDQNLLKIEVLKKGLIEQRKKTSDLEKEVIQLKEEVIVKQETIDKFKGSSKVSLMRKNK